MSGSNSKHTRADQRAQGTERRLVASQRQTEKKNKNRIRNTIIVVLIVLVVAGAFIVNSNLFYTGTTAVRVGGRSYTTAEYNYYYFTSLENTLTEIQNLTNSYGFDMSAVYHLDKNKPLKQQSYPGDEFATWADCFRSQALAQLKVLTNLLNSAEAEGFELSEEAAVNVDGQIGLIQMQYPLYNYTSMNQFLIQRYGKGMNEDVLRQIMLRSALAGEYQAHKQQALSDSFEQSELDAYYAENKATMDAYKFRTYSVAAEAETDENGESSVSEDALAAAQKTADDIAKAKTEEKFIDLVRAQQPAAESADEEDSDTADAETDPIDVATLREGFGSDYSTNSYFDWLSDASRKPGDTSTFAGESAVTVVMFISRDGNEYQLREARHILFRAIADETGSYSDTAKAEAKAKAEDALAQWNGGVKTEDSFAALANELSEDGGSNKTGGLYDEIYKKEMVQEFNDFVFDTARKPGDTGIVYGEAEGSYAGYHAIYYVGENSSVRYCDFLARNALTSKAYTDWQTAAVDSFTVKTTMSLHFAG